MDVNTVVTMSQMGWVGLMKIVAILVSFGGILVLSKKYLDNETYSVIKAKIMSFELKAELDYPGAKRGTEKMAFVEQLAMKNLSETELSFVAKKGGVQKIAEMVLPIIKSALPLVFKVRK